MAKAFNLTAQLNIQGPGNIKPVVSAIKRELGAIKANVQVDIKGSAAKNIDAVTKKLQLMSAAATQATGNINNLSQALAGLSSNIGNINSAASSTSSSVGQISSTVASAGKSISVATSQIEEFGKQSGLAIRRFAAFSTVTGVVYSLINAISSAYTEFLNFDKEIVRLSQVTNQSVGSLSGVTDEITRLSTNFGVASQDLLQVSVTLAQAGLSANDTKTALEALAKSALAPSFDNLSETVEGSIAAMRQFGIQAGELEGALGSINAVAAAFAVESSDIITAIQRTGGVFAAASRGVSEGTDALNEFIAVFTSVRATTRESAETIATGLRTIFTRIQRGGTIESLKQIGVSLTDVEGKFVGPYEAVRRLSEALSTLDPRDLRFSQIVEELGGFRQIGKVIPLIQQFSTAQEALKVAQRGQGSLAKDAITAQQSLAVQFTKTRESFVALVRDLGNSTTFRSIATISLTAANAFITLAGALKPLLPLLTALTAIKGASILTEFGSGFLGGLGKGGGAAASLGNMLGGGGGGGGPSGGGTRGGRGGGGGGGGGGSRSNNTAAIASNTTALSSNTASLTNLTTSVNNLISAINTSGGAGSAPLNNGGKVLAFARGGVVPGSGNRDTVPAMLQPGEFVIRKKAVETIGANKLHSINRYAIGGPVRSKKGSLGYSALAPIIIDPNDRNIQASHVGMNLGSLNPKEVESYTNMPVGRGFRSKKFDPEQTMSAGITASETFKLGLPAIANQSMRTGGPGVTTSALMDWIRKNPELLFSGRGTIPQKALQVSPQTFAETFASALEAASPRVLFDKHLSVAFERVRDLLTPTYLESRSGKVDLFSRPAGEERSQIRHEGFNIKKISDRFLNGGLIQKFENGGEAAKIKSLGRSKIMSLADKYGIGYDKLKMYDALGKRAPSIQESILIDGLVQQIVDRQAGKQQAEFRASDIAQRRRVAVVGITGDPGEEETRTVGATMEGVGSVRGVPVTLQRGALPKDLADRVQAMIRAKIEEVVAEVGSVIAERAGTTPDLKSIASITSKDIEDMTGPIFEKALGVASGNYDPMSKSVDFPSGLDPKVAALVGVEPGVMTDITNVASKEIAKSKILSGQIDRGRLEARARFGVSQFALGGRVYDLQQGTGLSDGEFNELVRYGKTNDFSEQEFKNYLAKYLSNKAAKKDLMMDPTQLREVLLSGTRTPSATSSQMDLARQLMGTPDSKYDPKYDRPRRFASGGSSQDTVPALLTPGEFVINRNAAKKIGYQKLNRLNKADKLQGFNKGGSVGNVLRMATGGSVSDDQMDYLRRKAQALGVTLEAYQKSIRDQIITTARSNVKSRESNKAGIQDTIIENISKINTAEVETSVREKLDQLIKGLDPGLKETEVKDRIDDIIQGMKSGLSVTDLKNTSASFKSVLDTEVKIENELSRVKQEFVDKLGFLTGAMKPRQIDIRASDPNADLGLLGRADPRKTQRFKESDFGQRLGRYGEALSGKNLPGLDALGSKFPELAKKIETITNKFGGLTGVFSAGSAVLASKLPDFYKSIDAFTQGNLQVSESAAGLVGALREGGSLGISGTLIGKQLYGQTGAAIGGTVGLAAGAVSGFLKDSTAKSVENALKQVNGSMNTLSKDLGDLSQARTVQEREDLTAKAEASYQAVLVSLDKSAKQIESNRGWSALQGAISGFVNALIQATSLITAIKVSQLSSATVLQTGGGGGGRRRSRTKSLGGRIGFFSRGGESTDGINWQPKGTDTIPAMLTAGEYVVNRESTSKNLALLETINQSRGGRIPGFSGGGSVKYFRFGGAVRAAGGPVGLAAALFTLGSTIYGAISGAFDADVQRQQLQAEVASLEALRSLVEASNSFSAINNQQYSDRVMAQSDIIEGAKLTPEQRIAQYGRFSDASGNLNEMNLLAEQNRRAELANKGFIVDQNQSVESYLDSLEKAGDARAAEARATANLADETLRRRAYIRARARQGAQEDVAAREYANKAPEAQTNINKLVEEELGRENRGKILADRLKIINSGLKETTLNIIDIMNRFSAAITRVGADIEGSIQRTSNAAQGLSGRASALGGTNDNVKIISNVAAASREELTKTVDTLVSSMGGGKEAQQIGGFVKALQVVQKELPLILRETKGGGLEEGSTNVIRARLNDMFKGTGIEQNIVNKMVNDTIKYLDSKASGRENFDMGELANDVQFMSEFLKTAETAQKSLQDYAEAQKNAISNLATISDDLSESFTRLTDNTLRARDINLRSAIELREQLGKNITFGERTQPFNASITGLTGGLLDPTAIGNQIADLIARKGQLEATPESQLGALGKGEIAKLTTQINKSQRALDTLANSTELASAALKKIDQQQQISAGQRRGVLDFFAKLNNPEAMIEMVTQKAAFDRVMGGGANREDIALATQVLPLLEQTRTPEDFASIQKQFFNNVVNTLQTQAGGANTPMGQGWDEFRRVFEGAFDQEQNQPLQASIETYNQVTQKQIEAIQAQSDLLLRATTVRTSELDLVAKQFTESLKTQFDKIVKELSDAAARIASVGMASGGIVKYFSMGGVDFTPKGTDTVPAMLTPGEFVVNRAATARNLPLLQSINSGKYSSGGKVTYLQKGGLLDRSVASRFPMLEQSVWSDISEGSSEIPAAGLTKNDLFRYIDYRKDSDDIVKKYEFDDYNSAVKHHYEQYLSQSADQRYKALVDKSDLIEKLEKERGTTSGLFGTTPGFLTGGSPQKYKELNKEINEARKWKDKELKSNINWYKTYEAAHAIKYSDRQVGDRNELEESYFGGDRNFPFTSNFQKIDNAYRRSQMGIEPADFETMMYGLATKAIPGLLGTIGGGLGVIGGGTLGLSTGPGAAVAAIGGGFLGGYIGDTIGQNINKYIWDNWTPQSVKDRIAKKMEEYPDSYAAGQWVGFGAEIAGGSVADDIIRKGVGSAGQIVSKQAQNLVSRNILKKLIKTIPSPIRAKDIPSKAAGLFDDVSGKIVRQSKRTSSGVVALDSDTFDLSDIADEDMGRVIIDTSDMQPTRRRETLIGENDTVRNIQKSEPIEFDLHGISLQDITGQATMRGRTLAEQFNVEAIKNIPQSLKNALEILGLPVGEWIKVLPDQIRFGNEAEILKRARGYFVSDLQKYDSGLPSASLMGFKNQALQKTLYHEMTHSLFDYVRKNGDASWIRYQKQIGEIFRGGDRRGLAKVYEKIKPGGAADALYGRQYKLGELVNVLDDPNMLDMLRTQIQTKSGPVKQFLETFLTTRNRNLSPYDENINDAINEMLELVGKGDKIPALENSGAEEFLANLVGSAEKLTNKQRGYLSGMLDDLLAGPPPITRDNSALKSMDKPTVFEKISQSFQRARASIKLPTIPRKPPVVKPAVKPDDGPAAVAPSDLPGVPSTTGPKPRGTKGKNTLGNIPGKALDWIKNNKITTAMSLLGLFSTTELFRGTGTPPTAPPSSAPPSGDVDLPPAVEEAKAKEAQQLIEGIRRKFESTSQDSRRAFGFDKYKFGESIFFKPDDPLQKVGFYARSVSLPKYELGAVGLPGGEFGIGEGELLDPIERKNLEARFKELEAENNRSPEYFALRRKIEEDYRAQLKNRSSEIQGLSVSEPQLPKIDKPKFGPNGPVSDADMKTIEGARNNDFVKDGQQLLTLQTNLKGETDSGKRKNIEDSIQKLMNGSKYSFMGLSASDEKDIVTLDNFIKTQSTDAREIIRQADTWDAYSKQRQEYNKQVQEYAQKYLLSTYKDSNTNRLETVPLTADDLGEFQRRQKELGNLKDKGTISDAEKAELARINDYINRNYKLQEDTSSEMMDYIFYNHPHDKSFQASLLNPFKNIGNNKLFGEMGNDARSVGDKRKNQLSQAIKDINLKYASAYGVNPANYMDIDSWISKIEPDQLSRIEEGSLPTLAGLPWTMDIFSNQFNLPEGIDVNNAAVKYGLWSLTDSGDAYDSKFGSNYTKEFLNRVKQSKTKAAKEVVARGNRLDKNKLETFIEMSKALNTYTSSMDGQLYNLPGVGPLAPTNILGNRLDDPRVVRGLLKGRTEKDKVAELQNIFGEAYRKFRKASLDKPFGYLDKNRLSDWETKDSVIKYPGTPEQLRATVLADSAALFRIDQGDPSFIKGNFRAQDALRVGAYANIFSQGAAANVEDVRGIEGVADPSKYSYAKLLTDAMNFDKDFGVSQREMMFDNFLGLDFNNNDKITDVYKASAAQLKADIQKIKSTYKLWDSLVYYDNIKELDNTNLIKARYTDAAGRLIDGKAPPDTFTFADGWSYNNDNKTGDFVSKYAQQINATQTEYARIIDALSYAAPKLGIEPAPENILNPYSNPDYIQIKKFKQLQDTSDTGGTTATGGTPAKSVGLAQDIKDQIKTAHVAVQLEATKIFGDNVLQQSEADKYTPLLDKLGSVLSTKVPNFNDPSNSKNLTYRAYRDNYTNSMKRFGDSYLLSDIEAPANKASMEKERKLRKELNSMVEPLYLSTGGRAVNFRPRGTDTVPAMLTPGEFVVNKDATRQHLPLLKSINQGNAPATIFGNTMHASVGGVVPKYLADGGVGSMIGSAASAITGFNVSALANIFTGFVDGFSKETKVFSTLIQDLARVFPALTGPVNLFGSHVDKFARKVDELKGIEIKGPSIADKVDVSGNVSLTIDGNFNNNNPNNNVQLDEQSINKIVNQVNEKLNRLIGLGGL